MSEEDSNIDNFADQIPLENQSADSTETELGQTRMEVCLLYTSPSPRDAHESRMPSSA